MECGYACSGSCGMRSFLTKEEKIQRLQKYKDALDKESEGVAERIAELQDSE